MAETVSDFKQRTDLAAIAYTLILCGIDVHHSRLDRLVTKFNSVNEVLIAYNHRLLKTDVDTFHKKKKTGR